jgi:hypothetical protein
MFFTAEDYDGYWPNRDQADGSSFSIATECEQLQADGRSIPHADLAVGLIPR